MERVIGSVVEVTVDRPMGSRHPKYRDLQYPINYGYVAGIMGGDGEAQDAYILGVDHPVKACVGTVIAIIRRRDDVEEKWVVAPQGATFTKKEIEQQVLFQEKYFDFEIVTQKRDGC